MVEEAKAEQNGALAQQGSVTVLLGAQWGDEGKGKVIDFLIGHNKVIMLNDTLLLSCKIAYFLLL